MQHYLSTFYWLIVNRVIFLQNIFWIILSLYYLIWCDISSLVPVFWCSWLFRWIPFTFISKEGSITFFNNINLLSIMGSPKICCSTYIRIFTFFVTFHPDPILPKYTDILPEFERIPCWDYCITNTGIIEIVFCLLSDLRSEISWITSYPLYDKRLFKKVEIAFYCFLIEPNFCSKFRVWY